MTGRLAIVRRELADRRRSLLGWSFGVAAFTALNVAGFPATRDNPEVQEMMEEFPPELLALFGSIEFEEAVDVILHRAGREKLDILRKPFQRRRPR